MSDADEPTPAEDGTELADASSSPPRAPSPASRARRIGGRPVPSPRPSPRDPAPSGAATASVDEATSPPSPGGRFVKRLRKSDPASDTESPRPTPSPRPQSDVVDASTAPSALRWLPAGVLGVGVIVFLVLGVLFSHGVYWAKPGSASRNQVREQVLASAKKCFATLNTYNYLKLPAAKAADAKCTTGAFTKQYQQAFAKQVAADAPAAKAVQTAQVNDAGIRSISGDGTQWTILIWGQLAISNDSTAKGTPRTDVFGAVVTMTKAGGKWLISGANTDVGDAVGN